MNTTCTKNYLHQQIKLTELLLIPNTFFEYFKDNNNPFDFSYDKVTNFVTAEFIDPEITENLIHRISTGEGLYSEFKSSQPLIKSSWYQQSDTGIHEDNWHCKA